MNTSTSHRSLGPSRGLRRVRSQGGRARPGLRAAAVAIIAGVLLVACQPLPPAPPGGETLACDDIAWGSTAKDAARTWPAPIVDARAGRHRCYDRFVVDIDGALAPGWLVRYGPVRQPGSGFVVPVRGGASLEIIARAPARDDQGATYAPADPDEVVDVAGFTTFRQAVYAGTFEGQTTFGLGVRARLPFRVFAIQSPEGSRVVVDVAHTWG